MFEHEPIQESSRELFNLDNVIMTPHMAATTEQSVLNCCTSVANDIVAVCNGQEPKVKARSPSSKLFLFRRNYLLKGTPRKRRPFLRLGAGGSQAELLLFIPTACGDAGKGAIVSRGTMAPLSHAAPAALLSLRLWVQNDPVVQDILHSC